MSFKARIGREYPGFPATQNQAFRLGQKRTPDEHQYIISVSQRLTQLSMKLIVLANTSLWFLYYVPRLIRLYLLFTSTLNNSIKWMLCSGYISRERVLSNSVFSHYRHLQSQKNLDAESPWSPISSTEKISFKILQDSIF